MPNLGQFHPQVVHFAVSLLLLGVALRIVSLTGRWKFTNAAAMLLLFGTAAAVVAVQSGQDAHGPVERIPGARAIVVEHEEHAHTTRTIFLVVAAIEIVGLILARRETMTRYMRYAHFASALVGIVGGFQLYETAEHGGELVYAYGGGPGLRSGDPADVGHLLTAGLYNQAMLDRRAGRPADAARLIDEMLRRAPGDAEIRLMHAESLILDRKDYVAARAAIDSVTLTPAETRLKTRQERLRAKLDSLM